MTFTSDSAGRICDVSSLVISPGRTNSTSTPHLDESAPPRRRAKPSASPFPLSPDWRSHRSIRTTSPTRYAPEEALRERRRRRADPREQSSSGYKPHKGLDRFHSETLHTTLCAASVDRVLCIVQLVYSPT